MGLSSSKNTNANDNNDWEIAKKRADNIYNYRIKNYNYMRHGPQELYMLQVEAEYELECIPEYLRSGGGHAKW